MPRVVASVRSRITQEEVKSGVNLTGTRKGDGIRKQKDCKGTEKEKPIVLVYIC